MKNLLAALTSVAAVTLSLVTAWQPTKKKETLGAHPLVASSQQSLKSQVYLLSSNAGWPRDWDVFNQVWSGMTDPANPKDGANPAYYFKTLADKATLMGVDGIVFTPPHVPSPPEDPDHWRMHFEGRLDALRNNPNVADFDKIRTGLEYVGENFNGKVVLYVGYPDVRDRAIITDTGWADSYVRVSIGPYLTPQTSKGYVVTHIIFDTMGDYAFRPECQAVINSVKRQYPWVAMGAEVHPQARFDRYANFSCSLTTQEAFTHVLWDSPERKPWKTMVGPVLVVFNIPAMVEFSDLKTYLGKGYSVSISAWQVGLEPRDVDTVRWKAWSEFMTEVRRMPLRGNVTTPPVPISK